VTDRELQGSSAGAEHPGRAPVTITLPPYPAAAERAEIGLEFSPDGRLLLVDAAFGVTPGTGPAHATVQVWGLDGGFVFAPPVTDASDVPVEAAWGTDGTLYYSAPQGVTAGDPRSGATRLVLPGTRWVRPSVSPDGRFIAFGTTVGEVPRLRVLNMRAGVLLAGFDRQWAVNPRYVTATRLWFNEAEALSQSMMPYRATDRIVSRDWHPARRRRWGSPRSSTATRRRSARFDRVACLRRSSALRPEAGPSRPANQLRPVRCRSAATAATSGDAAAL
jgi:hypothetical protein